VDQYGLFGKTSLDFREGVGARCPRAHLLGSCGFRALVGHPQRRLCNGAPASTKGE